MGTWLRCERLLAENSQKRGCFLFSTWILQLLPDLVTCVPVNHGVLIRRISIEIPEARRAAKPVSRPDYLSLH